jgi:signal transduction histidine kinase/ligand-binding sensor domain-containing protein
MVDWNLKRPGRHVHGIRHAAELMLVGFARLHSCVGRAGLVLLWGLLALNASAATSSFRADPDYLIDTWEGEDTWPGSPASTMAQAPDGYLWLGTREGLVRFDGLKFTLFDQTSLPKPPNKAVVKLHLDRSGNLWAGTVKGIAVRNGADWRAVALPGTDNNRGNYLVDTLAERPGGGMLATTRDGGVLEFTGGQFHLLPPPPGATNTSYWGCADDAGNWWVAQHKFVGKWDGQRWVETVSLAETTNLAPHQVACATGRAGGLWLLLGPELRQYRGGAETQRTPLTRFKGEVADLLEDSRGNVWIATRGAGLWQVSSKGLVQHWSRSNGLANNNVPFVFEDRERNVWAGMGHGGLTRLKQRTFQSFLTVTDRLAFARFAVAASPTGGVFIASWRDGLWRANAEGVTKVPLPKPFTDSSVSALSLLADHAGRLWIGAMTNGVWRVEGQDAQGMPIDDSGRSPVYAIFEDSRGRIWLAGGQAVSVFEGGAMRGFGSAQGLPPGPAIAFAEDKSGAIWLAHSRGVFRLETNRWVEVLDAKGGSLGMSHLLADADGTLWMGSAQQGLACWQDGRLFQKSLPPALPMRGVYTLLEDHLGFFWMTSNQGVLRARKSDLKSWLDGKQPAVTWQVFDVGDGLPAVECAGSARDEQGRVWFATARGVANAEPAADRPNQTPPPVQIEELTYHRGAPRVYGDAAPGAPAPTVRTRLQGPFPEKLTLPSGSRRIEVHYTALDYTAPEKLRFQTRLEPGDSDWQDVGGRRVAYYYDFNPGSYVFRVRAVNHGGVWSEPGASLAFMVQPFFWQTWWLRVVALVALAGTGGMVGWRRSHLRHRRELKELERNRRHQAELAHVARVSTMGQLASSLAHELNQPLGAILRNAEAAELFLQEPSPDLDEVRAILADIRKDDQRAGEVIERMRALMKRREVERCLLDLNLLAGEVIALVRPDAELRRVRLVVEANPALPSVHGDRVQLQQVVLNLLLNALDAVKDSPPAKRRVAVRARPAGATVELTVSDNGHGIPADRLPRVFEPFFTSKPDGLGMGLPISRSIVEAHGGRLWAENNPAGGAAFTFTLPAAKEDDAK